VSQKCESCRSPLDEHRQEGSETLKGPKLSDLFFVGLLPLLE